MPKHFDVAIAGAGPAGAHLAFRLADAGCRTVLFDPKTPWEKPCGGGITHKAWSRFPVLTSADLPRNEASESIQISATGKFFVIDQGHPLFIVSRSELSRVMLEAAVRAGAEYVPSAVREIVPQEAGVRLITDEATIEADRVVGADGVHSLVRRTFVGSIPGYRTMPALCRFYEGGPEDPTITRVTPFPGYAWSFPRRDCLAVGVGAHEPGHDLKSALDRFMLDFFPQRKPLGPLQGGVLPCLTRLKGYRTPRAGTRFALVGDAAGFCDTMTGEGILYAIWSADLLADACLKGDPRKYDSAWRRAFGLHLLMGSLLRNTLFSAHNIDRAFTALTVCPAFRKPVIDFVQDLPPYHRLAVRLVAALPATCIQWHRFLRRGGRIEKSALGPFTSLSDRLDLQWHLSEGR